MHRVARDEKYAAVIPPPFEIYKPINQYLIQATPTSHSSLGRLCPRPAEIQVIAFSSQFLLAPYFPGLKPPSHLLLIVPQDMY